MNTIDLCFNAKSVTSQKESTTSSPQRAGKLTFSDQGTIYKIEVDFEDLRQLEATFKTKQQKKARCPVEWQMPILSKEKLRKYLDPSQLRITVERDLGGKTLRILLLSPELQKDADTYFQEFNTYHFIQDRWRIGFWTNWCQVPKEDSIERKQFLWSLVDKSRGHLENGKAAAHAITLLKLCGEVLNEHSLEGCELPQADLSGAVLSRVNCQKSNLQGVNFHLADLSEADLRMSQLSGASFGRLPSLHHKDFISSLAISSDDRYLAVGSAGTLHLWDGSNLRLLHAFPKAKMPLTSLAFSSDGKWLATGDRSSHVAIWDMETLEKIAFFDGPNKWGVARLTFSMDDRYLAAYLYLDGVYVWQIAKENTYSSKLIQKRHWQIMMLSKSFAFSPVKPHWFVIQRKDIIMTWDLKEEAEVQRWTATSYFDRIEFTSDGQQLMAIDSLTIFLGNINSEKLQVIIREMPNGIRWGTFTNNDSQIVYMREDGLFIRYDIKKRQIIDRFAALHERMFFPLLSHRSDQLFLGTRDGKVHVLDVKTTTLKGNVLDSDILGIAFADDQQNLILWLRPNKAQKYHLLTGSHLDADGLENFKSLADTKEEDEKQYIQQCPNIKVALYQRLMSIFKEMQPFLSPASFTKLSVNLFVLMYPYTSTDDTPNNYKFDALTLSQDYRYLAFLNNGRVDIWDANAQTDNKCILTLDTGFRDKSEYRSLPGIAVLAFGPTPKTPQQPLYLATSTNEIQIWALREVEGKLQAHCQAKFKEYQGRILNLRFTPDGRFLLSSCLNETVVRKWDIQSGEEVTQLKGHSSPILGLDLNETANLLVTGGGQLICLWNLTTGAEKGKIDLDFNVERLHLSQDGAFLVGIAVGLRAIYVWKLKEVNSQIQAQLLWRIPQRLSCHGIKLHPKDTLPTDQDLSEQNRALLLQMGAKEEEGRLIERIWKRCTSFVIKHLKEDKG